MIAPLALPDTLRRPPWISAKAPALTKIVSATQGRTVEQRLAAHLQTWLGVWPSLDELQLVLWPGRDEPGWDGGTWLGLGIESPGGTVFSLSPTLVSDAGSVDVARVAAALRSHNPAVTLPAALGMPNRRFMRAVFRWADHPSALPEVGEWVSPDDDRLPAWLRPFNGDVLVAWDEAGRFVAGVGRKQHNRHGHELAVATEPGQQGRGLARMLVAQAARRVLADGAAPLYLHEIDNVASARVAEAAGFSDLGWRIIGLR